MGHFRRSSAIFVSCLLAAGASAQTDPSIPAGGQSTEQSGTSGTALKVQRLKLQQLEIFRTEQKIEQQELRRQRGASLVQPLTAAQTNIPSLATLLKPDQFVAAGLSKLNPSEMTHLDCWFSGFLDKYTQLLRDGFEAQRLEGSDLEADFASVERVFEDGKVVRLLDGSEWQVQVGDTVRSSQWVSPSPVVIVKAAHTNNAVLIHDRDSVHALRTR